MLGDLISIPKAGKRFLNVRLSFSHGLMICHDLNSHTTLMALIVDICHRWLIIPYWKRTKILMPKIYSLLAQAAGDQKFLVPV